MTVSLSGSAPSPLVSRRALLFIDLGWLRARGAEQFGSERVVCPVGVGRLIADSTQSAGPFSATMQRAYIYDAVPPGPKDHRWEEGDPEPQARPTSTHHALAATDQVTMRYGRLVKGRQKGVDTRLVADLIRFSFTGTCQVAHIMAYDTDYEEPVRTVADIGVQVVLYELEDDPALPDQLRQQADRVIALPTASFADLFEVPRYWVLEQDPELDSDALSRLDSVLRAGGVWPAKRRDRANVLVSLKPGSGAPDGVDHDDEIWFRYVKKGGREALVLPSGRGMKGTTTHQDRNAEGPLVEFLQQRLGD